MYTGSGMHSKLPEKIGSCIFILFWGRKARKTVPKARALEENKLCHLLKGSPNKKKLALSPSLSLVNQKLHI
jgi:hypothetical protein